MDSTIKLKKMLLSRNIVLQDKSIQFMINKIKDPKQFQVISTIYLNADMIQFLCEPLLSICVPLIQNICTCIWMLSKNSLFYERNDVIYTCNSLMRTLVFLIRSNDPTMSYVIQLLAIIIKKGGTNLRDICNVPQVLTVIKLIFTNSQSLPDRCVINAISILTYFLLCPSIELSNQLYNTSISISKAICRSVTEEYSIDPHEVDIASSLSSGLLRLYSTITRRVLIDENLKKHEKMAKLLKNIAWYMIKNISLPFVLKNININVYFKSYQKGIRCLLSPFKENLSIHIRQNIANHYAASRIIRTLYELIEFDKIAGQVEELLFEMLFYLSLTYLEINCQWPGGIDMFRNQIVQNLKNFPKTPKDICLALMDNKNTNMGYCIIIFLYFYLLTCSNVEDESLYLEPICIYLCNIQIEIPIPVIKAILFNISISFVSHHALNAVTGLAYATKKLAGLMSSQVNNLIFTNHPALLYFLFATSLIPEKIQLQLVKHWIINLDDISSIELEKFCLKNYKAKLCLLNILINDNSIKSNKLQIGFNIIKNIIIYEKERNEHKTLLIIWDMLPTNLGSFCCTENSKIIGASNLIFLLNLIESFSFCGFNVSINEHRNIVYTIISIIKCYQFTFTEQYLLLSCLLQHFITLIQLPNVDVLNTIKKHKNFLYVLENLCSSENDEVCYLTFNTIIKLCQLEKEKTKREDRLLCSISMKSEYILNAMSRRCHNCIISSITLFQIIIQNNDGDICNMIEFNKTPTVEFLKSVFIQLETIVFQGLDLISDHAWECMMTILSVTLLNNLQKLSETQQELATDPWLNFLLTNLKSYSEKCLEFLHFWLAHFVLS